MMRPALRGRLDRSFHDAGAREVEVDVTIVGIPSFTGGLKAAVDRLGVAAAIGTAFRERGAGLLDDLHGSFALAVVDVPGHAALLAVDRVGIETLCYATDASRLFYGIDAGDVAALMHGAAVGATVDELDPQSIFDYLYFHCIPGPSTVYRGVSRLAAGHYLAFGADVAKVDAYWSPTYVEHRGDTSAALETDFLETVRGAVSRAIDGAAQPGCFLSGGTDSSTVAGMLRDVTGTAPRSYSIGFDADGFDEMSYARIAAKRYGTDHHEYYITPADLVASIPAIASAYDQPFGNSSVLPTYYCAKIAKADGVDRMLGGDGGDELFGGNTRYAKQRVFGYFDQSPAPIKAALRSALAPAAWDRIPVVRKARSYVAQASVPMPDRMQTYNLLSRIGPDAIFEPSFMAQVDADAPMRQMRTVYAQSARYGLVNRMLAFDLKYTLTDSDLPKVMTACHLAGVDVAFPFLDDAVVAFAGKLSPDLKLKGLKLRWFFKHALRDFLPPEILVKSKHGFGLPFGIWLGRDPALRDLAFGSLESLKRRGIVRTDFIDRLRADLVADHATYYGELVWVLMMLEQWLQARPARHNVAASA